MSGSECGRIAGAVLVWAACAAAGCGGGTGPARTTGETVSSVARPVTVEAVRQVEYRPRIDASGTALPVRESLIAAAVSGRIEAILVREGDRVRKGQPLVRFEQAGFELTVQQAEAGLAAAVAQADGTRLEFERMRQLRESDAVARANYDRVEAGLRAAEAGVRAAEAQLGQARKYLRDSTIYAPYDGAVTMILKDVGEYATQMPPSPLVQIVDSSSLEVQLFLPEEHASSVRSGDEGVVRIDNAGAEVRGRVTFVSDRIEPQSHNFEVRVAIPNPGLAIKAGSFARVSLIRPSVQAVLVPVRGVRREADGTPVGFVAVDGRARLRPVRLGADEGDRVQVVEGLTAGELLIVSGAEDLGDGDPVRPAE